MLNRLVNWKMAKQHHIVRLGLLDEFVVRQVPSLTSSDLQVWI